MSALSTEEISKVLDLACALGKESISNGAAPPYSDSTVSEGFLVDLIKKAMVQSGHDANQVTHHGGHAFPDVSISGSGVGIELKGATSNRKFNGNSVVASTMLPNLKKIFLMYWIGRTGDIGHKDYFDCVATPVVTHSPRFQLDIDLDKNSSMFGLGPGKIGPVDEVIFSRNGIDSEKIIKWMSDKAKRNNETPWWISTDESLPTGSTGITKFTNMPEDKKRYFLKCAFLSFPKILDRTSPTKYNGLFEWAIQTHSAYTTRDDYSAGGQITITLPNFNSSPITLPQCIQGALDSLADSAEISALELERVYEKKFKDAEDFLSTYKKRLIENVRHMYVNVKSMDTNNIGEDAFANMLSDLLTSKIDKNSIVFAT